MAMDLIGLTPLLQVYDMPTSIRFYRDLLGFEVIETSPVTGPDFFHWAMLRLGGATLMLNTAYEFDYERPVPPDAGRVVGHNDTGLYFGCSNLEEAYVELQEKGVTVTSPKQAPYGMLQMPVRDPDGYFLCFQAPTNT